MKSLDQKKELEQRLIEKAMKDELFRKRLLSNPKETIEQEVGFTIPATLHIRVLEEDANTFYLVLPPKGSPESADELTETELEAVSGGLQDNYSAYIHCSAGTLCTCTG